MRKRLVADLFCGAGGSSSGAARAITRAGEKMELVAVNHWPVAIESHTLNHPDAEHYCIDLDAADPEKLVPGGYLDLLLASPECKDFSSAKGGKPVSEQKRASAWHVPRWADRLYIRQIIVENVPRFQKWGPLDRYGRPIKSKEGEMFQAWLNVLRSMNYKVEYRVLNAADYGDPQSRERLFIMARKDGKRVVWPVASHAKNGAGGMPRWRSAREVIDFSIPSRDALEPGRDLSPNTIARIKTGMQRFNPTLYEPFLVVLRNHMDVQSIDEPLPTITSGGTHLALAQPFTIPQGGGGMARSIEDPLSTIATDGAIGVAEPYLAPFIVPQRSMQRPINVSEPLPTITCTSRGIGLAEPYLVTVNHPGERKNPDLDEPLPTITAKNGVGLAEPFLTAHFRERKGQAPRVHDIDQPFPTVTHRGAGDLCIPSLEPASDGAAPDQIVMVDGIPHILRVKFRMLQPSELQQGQGFEKSYKFAGNKSETTAMIGNAVPVHLSAALVNAALYGTVADTLDVAV